MTSIVAVWYGEFGWELACWQGYLRRLSKTQHVHVICPHGHQSLYTDFAASTSTHTLRGDRDCWRIRGNDKELTALISRASKQAAELRCSVLYPRQIRSADSQLFIKFGQASNIKPEDRFDVLLHTRNRVGRGAERNTDIESAMDLVHSLKGLRVASIGTYHEAKHVTGTSDLRGVLLEHLMDHIAAAKVVVGPASGPSVLALLCGTPGVVWSSSRWYSSIRATNRERLTNLWNPFKTPVTVMITPNFNPSPEESLKAIQEITQLCPT